MGGNGASADTFEDRLQALGFRLSGSSRRGGRLWALAFNSYLTFTLHDYHDSLMLTWRFALGEFAADHGWMLGTGEPSMHELYPRSDTELPVDADAVGEAVNRVRGELRLDLGNPAL